MCPVRANFRLTAEQRADARAAILLLENSGLNLEGAAKLALHIEGSSSWKEATIERAIDDFLADCRERVKAGALRIRTAEFYEENLWAFEGSFQGRTVDEISRKRLSKYLAQLPVSPTSRAVRFRALRAWLNWCERQDPALVRENPCRGLQLPKVVQESEIAFLSIDEVKAILEAPTPHRWSLALQLFAGIRPEEISSKHKAGLQWEHINRKEKLIRIPADMAKGSRRGSMARLIDQAPKNLWGWLKDGPETGPVCPVLPYSVRAMAKRLGGFNGKEKKWPHDGLRRTFATYHVAAYGDPGKTALIMGHRGSTDMLHRHYRGLATKDQGDSFFRIRHKD